MKSYLPKSAQKKRIKRPVIGMCHRCGTEFFTKKEFHKPAIGCGKIGASND